MKHAIATGTLVLAAMFGAQSPAFADSPGTFTIKSLQYAGSGCAAGSVAGNVSPDRQAFTLLFDSYVAEVGPGVSLSAGRRNCQLAMTFDCPAGWQFALVDLDTRGYVQLDSNVAGTQKTAFYFQGSAQTASLERTTQGPTDGDYQFRDTVPATQRAWGQCGRNTRALNVNTQVRLDNSRNRSGRGLITVDSIDGNVRQTFGIVWERSSL